MFTISRLPISTIICSSILILYVFVDCLINHRSYSYDNYRMALPYEYDDRRDIVGGIRSIDRTPNYPYYDNQLLSYQNNVYLEKYRLHYCKIDKNMGSTMQALLCFIDDHRAFAHFFNNQSWGPGLTHTKCGASTERGALRKRFLAAAVDNDEFFDKKSNIVHLAVIRHPVSRFLSAFADICANSRWKNTTCYGCGSNMSCFLPKLHRDLLHHALHLPLKRWPLDWHFFPQAWFCEFGEHFQLYKFIRYERSDSFWNTLIEKSVSNINYSLQSIINYELKKQLMQRFRQVHSLNNN